VRCACHWVSSNWSRYQCLPADTIQN
jgi:hypothetical protein